MTAQGAASSSHTCPDWANLRQDLWGGITLSVGRGTWVSLPNVIGSVVQARKELTLSAK